MVPNLSMEETIAIKESNRQRMRKLYKTLDTIHFYPSQVSREVVNIPAKQTANVWCREMHVYAARQSWAKPFILPKCALARLQLYHSSVQNPSMAYHCHNSKCGVALQEPLNLTFLTLFPNFFMLSIPSELLTSLSTRSVLCVSTDACFFTPNPPSRSYFKDLESSTWPSKCSCILLIHTDFLDPPVSRYSLSLILYIILFTLLIGQWRSALCYNCMCSFPLWTVNFLV